MSAGEQQLLDDIEEYVSLHGKRPRRGTILGNAAYNIGRRKPSTGGNAELVHRLGAILAGPHGSRYRSGIAPLASPSVVVISPLQPTVSVGQEGAPEERCNVSPQQQVVSLPIVPVGQGDGFTGHGNVSPEQPAVPVPTVSVGQGQGGIGPVDGLVAGINATSQQPTVPVGMAGIDPVGGTAAQIDVEFDLLRPVMAQSLMPGRVGPSEGEFSRLVQQLNARESELDGREDALDAREAELKADRAIVEAVRQRQAERERELILIANAIEKARLQRGCLGNRALPHDVMAMLAG